MTTRSQKRKAIEELVSTEIETPIPEANQNLNPVAGTSKSPRILTENLEEIRSSLRREIMSDLTKILAENQKEMLKLIAPVTKKHAEARASEETDSDPENIPENATSTPIKTKTTATTRKITPVSSRNNRQDMGYREQRAGIQWHLQLHGLQLVSKGLYSNPKQKSNLVSCIVSSDRETLECSVVSRGRIWFRLRNN